MSTNPEITDYYQWSCAFLSEICRQEQVRCVVHAHYSRTESSTACGRSASMKMKDRIERIIETNKDCFLWENTRGLFSFTNPYFLSKIIQPLQLPLCFDVSHAFISVKGNNQKLLQIILRIHAYIHYYHIVDSAGTRHNAFLWERGESIGRASSPC
ncbi:hypothetical protein EWH99_11320 [Sporolactobacillus sp. THM7-7]|nr:hypothetical protein EWH99_11320 [Sporolactobacillus sp. THM7-7]